jgi:hypothetical protein
MPKLDKEALFGAVAYRPHAGQKLVHASEARIRVLACGSRFGKSLCGVMELLAFTLEPGPAARAWITAPRFEVVDMLLELLLTQLRRGLPHRIVEADQRGRRVVVRNLANKEVVVEGRCTERVASLLGVSLDFLLVDEAGRVQDAAWEGALSARLVEREGRALVVGTPRHEGSWFHKLYLLGRGGDPDVESWSAPTTTNPSIDPVLVERERARLSIAEFASEFLGRFTGPQGPLCESCGAPWEVPLVYAILLEGQELGGCQDCGRRLNQKGEPVGEIREDGTTALAVIRLVSDVPPPHPDDPSSSTPPPSPLPARAS